MTFPLKLGSGAQPCPYEHLVCFDPRVKLRYGWVLSARIYDKTSALFRSSLATCLVLKNMLVLGVEQLVFDVTMRWLTRLLCGKVRI